MLGDKIFLTATPEARAKRRFEELSAKGVSTTYDAVYNEMIERDKNDSTRALAPCVQAEDAILLDNSDMSADQTVEAVLDIIKKHEKKRKTGYMKLHKFLAPFFRFVLRLHPHGKDNIPSDGGVIICSNHISAIDVLSIAAVCPRQVTFIAKKELFSIPVLGAIIKALGAVKVDRGNNDVGAIRTSISQAEKGSAVAIFPQGHRYPGVDPATTPTKNGAAMIAYHSKCDVLPVYLQTNKARFRLFRKIDVIFGDIIPYYELGFEKGGREEYENTTKKIFNAVLALGDRSSLPAFVEEKKPSKKRKK